MDAIGMMLTADKILETRDIPKPERVNVPEWNAHLFVRVMSGVERDQWELVAERGVSNPTQANIRASLVAMCACDESGKRLFTSNQAANLGQKSAVALDRIFAVAKRINRLDDKDIKELEGN